MEKALPLPENQGSTGASRRKLVWGLVLVASILVFLSAKSAQEFAWKIALESMSREGRALLVSQISTAVSTYGNWGPAVFVAFLSVISLFLPATPFILASAVIFGKYMGAAYSITGCMIGAAIAFSLSRYFLQEVTHKYLTGKLANLESRFAENGLLVVLSLRVMMCPFMALNYAAGATSIKWRDYMLGTLLGITGPILLESGLAEMAKHLVT